MNATKRRHESKKKTGKKHGEHSMTLNVIFSVFFFKPKKGKPSKKNRTLDVIFVKFCWCHCFIFIYCLTAPYIECTKRASSFRVFFVCLLVCLLLFRSGYFPLYDIFFFWRKKNYNFFFDTFTIELVCFSLYAEEKLKHIKSRLFVYEYVQTSACACACVCNTHCVCVYICIDYDFRYSIE